MRNEGTLKTWHDNRGFGFIAPAQGGAEIFVHVSAFPRDGKRPMAGETLSFEITVTDDGKKQAVRVERPSRTGSSAVQSTPDFFKRHAREPLRMSRRPAQRHGWAGKIVTLIVLVALGGYGYKHYQGSQAARPAAPPQAVAAPVQELAPASFRCDGRTHCSQMTSCAEATYFLRNCPNTKMDGNNDGVPCEVQWCTGK